MFDAANVQRFVPLQQTGAYAAAAVACGAAATLHDLGCGTALAVERGRVRLISRGPVWAEGAGLADKRRALRRLARWPGITIVTPEEGITGFGLLPVVTPMHHAVWSLGPDLRCGMAGKWRNRLVAAERAGVDIQIGDRGTLAGLIAEEARQRAMKRYRSLPEAFTRALPETALRIWEWRESETLGAAMAFVVAGQSATYHLGWGSLAARAAGVHAVMLVRAAEALWRDGVRWLDLGSVDTERAPGLARFKLGTGAELRRLGATMLVLP